VSDRSRSQPPSRRHLAGDEPTQASPVEALLTPPGGSDGSGEPTQGMPVNLTALANGRYVLGRQLGAGGMGIVRVAHDEVLHREVAVKLLADNLAADPEARERFLREARAAARIHDPHVVAVHDVGDEAGRPYLVMEHVDGPSLADVLATEGKLDPHEVVEVAAQALAGITRAHDAGLLHRDVKPGNLLRAPDGTIKVTDFGVAEAADAPGLTRTGFVIGTRSYLAPERRRGMAADARTDLYALGATLVELLTGRPPSDDPFELPEDTPNGLARLVGKLLSEDPHDRPADTEEALAILAGNGRTTAEEAAGAIDEDAALDGQRLAADRTEQLPVEPSRRPFRRASSRRSDDADSTARARRHGRATEDDAETPGRVIPWRTVLVIGAVLLAIVVVLQLATGGDGSTTEEAGADPAVDPVDPVERAEDPETTARNLAEWLRELDGQAETADP
jgi:eukaryotic-like serine/threonine-protein kinase